MTVNRSSWNDRDQFELIETTENSDDLLVRATDFEDLQIVPSDWTVRTIYELIGRQLQLDPAYQRRNVWQAKAKSQFIESLILGIPIPQILLATNKKNKNEFYVLDGKQRLTAIKEFFDGRFVDGSEFKLTDLKILDVLNGKRWTDICDDFDWSDRLQNETVRTTVLKGWTTEAVLYEIFYRLNSGSVRLSPMELRMSLHPGPFLKYIIAWSEKIGPIHGLLRKKQPDPRMADVELAIRHLAFMECGEMYAGNLKEFLDEYCKHKNSDLGSGSDSINVLDGKLNSMNDAIAVGMNIFNSKFCRKFQQGSYEPRFNRAVFDVMVGSLSDGRVRKWASDNSSEFVSLYEGTCESDPEFIRSIETTTKSLEATAKRFSVWYGKLRDATGIDLDYPL